MHDTPQWRQTLEQIDWEDNFLAGDEFAEYVEEDARTTKLLKDLGVIG